MYQNNINKKALIFGLVAVFLCGMGFGVVSPVIPFLVERYVASANQALSISLLMAIYALFVFLVAPGMGSLSDHFGRRPILLTSLVISAIGYLIFGFGSSLWLLFLGRMVEGIGGASISTIFAYFADIIPAEKRTKYFGWLGAVVGLGSAFGPVLGGILSSYSYSLPMFVGAGVTLLNALFGYFFMSESLSFDRRVASIELSDLNPFAQLASIFSLKNIKWILISGFFVWLPNGSLQAIFPKLTIDSFNWQPTLIGLMFSIIGLQDILSQVFIMPKLVVRLTDKKITRMGMFVEVLAYILIAISVIVSQPIFFILGMFTFGFGDSIYGPAYSSMLSKLVKESEQGRLQGTSQSIQALARIIGPLIGGVLYSRIDRTAPGIFGIILILLAILVMTNKIKK